MGTWKARSLATWDCDAQDRCVLRTACAPPDAAADTRASPAPEAGCPERQRPGDSQSSGLSGLRGPLRGLSDSRCLHRRDCRLAARAHRASRLLEGGLRGHRSCLGRGGRCGRDRDRLGCLSDCRGGILDDDVGDQDLLEGPQRGALGSGLGECRRGEQLLAGPTDQGDPALLRRSADNKLDRHPYSFSPFLSAETSRTRRRRGRLWCPYGTSRHHA